MARRIRWHAVLNTGLLILVIILAAVGSLRLYRNYGEERENRSGALLLVLSDTTEELRKNHDHIQSLTKGLKAGQFNLSAVVDMEREIKRAEKLLDGAESTYTRVKKEAVGLPDQNLFTRALQIGSAATAAQHAQIDDFKEGHKVARAVGKLEQSKLTVVGATEEIRRLKSEMLAHSTVRALPRGLSGRIEQQITDGDKLIIAADLLADEVQVNVAAPLPHTEGDRLRSMCANLRENAQQLKRDLYALKQDVAARKDKLSAP